MNPRQTNQNRLPNDFIKGTETVADIEALIASYPEKAWLRAEYHKLDKELKQMEIEKQNLIRQIMDSSFSVLTPSNETSIQVPSELIFSLEATKNRINLINDEREVIARTIADVDYLDYMKRMKLITPEPDVSMMETSNNDGNNNSHVAKMYETWLQQNGNNVGQVDSLYQTRSIDQLDNQSNSLQPQVDVNHSTPSESSEDVSNFCGVSNTSAAQAFQQWILQNGKKDDHAEGVFKTRSIEELDNKPADLTATQLQKQDINRNLNPYSLQQETAHSSSLAHLFQTWIRQGSDSSNEVPVTINDNNNNINNNNASPYSLQFWMLPGGSRNRHSNQTNTETHNSKRQKK